MSLVHKKNSRGFTLIEVLMVIALTAILAVISIGLYSDSLDDARFQDTLAKMTQIKNAMIGDPNIKEGTTRTSFGFLGDMGALPAVIGDLVTNPGHGSYAISSSARMGAGWNGPYMAAGSSGVDYTVDAWGTAFVYDLTITGLHPAPTLTSYGADRTRDVGPTTGLNKDITITLPVEQTSAAVNGFVCNSGGPYTGAFEAELNYPSGYPAGDAVATTMVPSALAPADGQFQFASVPFGIRSVTVYIPTKASPTQTLGPILITVDKPNYLVPCERIDINP